MCCRGRVEPDELAVGQAILHFDRSCQLVVGVGSGVINNIGKILSHTATLPMTFRATKDLRDKYVLSRLCWDLGVPDELCAAPVWG